VSADEIVKMSITFPHPLGVPCPKCGAVARASCVSPRTGKPWASVHKARINAAFAAFDAAARGGDE